MSNYKYNDIVKTAKTIQKNVKNDYELGVTPKWCYYLCKAITDIKTKEFEGIKFADAKKVKGDHISRQIFKSSYIDMAERIIRYTEREEQLPSTVGFTTLKGKTYRININLATEMFSRILVYYDTNKAYPKYANINSKVFTKPTENKNTVFTRFVNKFKFTPKCLDDVCDFILKYFTYLFYYDDIKSNAEVIEDEAGNCTDLLQFLINMAEALGYDWKVIHTQCKQSGVGHVYGMFRKDGVNNGEWFVRDIACIADESRYCVWCEVPDGGYKLAENPSWFLENLRR